MTKRKVSPEAAGEPGPNEGGWIDAGEGYALALVDRRLVCRNAVGKRLASVPKAVAQGEAAGRLLALRDWLEQHQRTCLATVEGWMLRSLPVPRAVVASALADPAWRTPLENAVVWPLDASGAPDLSGTGFLRAEDPARGLGVVDLEGETRWLDPEAVAIPHPILLPTLGDLRELAAELGLSQGLAQLFRETFPRAPTHAADATGIDAYADGKFAQLTHATGKAKQLGYRVRGGYACCPVLEGGRRVEARYWIGAEAPDVETSTGDLCFVDERERPLTLGVVGPIAYSEGVRMASAIYGARVVAEDQA